MRVVVKVIGLSLGHWIWLCGFVVSSASSTVAEVEVVVVLRFVGMGGHGFGFCVFFA